MKSIISQHSGRRSKEQAPAIPIFASADFGWQSMGLTPHMNVKPENLATNGTQSALSLYRLPKAMV
jgi:hypothetical protein